MRKQTRDILTIGFALFAMFFGAGNLLLPPYIGIQVGNHVWITILAFGLTGILLPFLGVLSVVKAGERFEDLGARIHPLLAPVLGSVIMLCIGPLIAIPRTAATTHEVGIVAALPGLHPAWTSIVFFAITWILTIRPSRVVDIIGNILTPLLLVLLVVLILAGIFSPLDGYQSSRLSGGESFTLGFVEGYQTLDVLASVIFAGIIIAAAKLKGHETTASKSRIVISAGMLSAIFLLVVYGGLIQLGATSGITDLGIKRSELLLHISFSILGQYGAVIIGIAIALACLTTAVALVTAFGTFFFSLFGGRVGYTFLVSICCAVSAILSVTGVDNIIMFAYPVLGFVYPIAITLILYWVLFGRMVTARQPFIAAILASTLVAFCYLLIQFDMLGEVSLRVLRAIPFFQYELGWVIPSAIAFFVSWAVYRRANE